MLKSIYNNRINTLVREYEKFHQLSEKKHDKVLGFSSILDELKKDIENISYDDDIEPNKKYILISEKLEYIEKVVTNMSKLKNDVLKVKNKLDKEKTLLIEQCLEDHKNLTESDILNEFSKFLTEREREREKD